MPGTSWARIAPERVEWGLTLCSLRKCAELAACTLEGWPYCIRHADDVLERELALELNPGLTRLLPDLEEGPW